MRKLLGKFIEWLLCYNHVVYFSRDDEHCKLPYKSYSGDAGSDLFCSRRTTVPARGSALVPSGLRVDAQSMIWFELGARSSTFRKLGLEVVVAVIDKDFRGELFAQVINPGNEDVVVERGHRVVQIIPHRLIPVRFIEGKLSESSRGESGFGSSGR